MASRSEIARQDQASEQRRNDACANIIIPTDADPHTPENARGITVGVLSALIEAIDAEAADVRELRRKGWQSRETALVTAAGNVRIWRDRLVEYTPPRAEALPQPAEIAVDHRADTPAELERRLTEAFGPELRAPVRHIRCALDPEPEDPPGDASKYGPMCGATDGSFTHPGGANCPDCHAAYAEQNDGKPYDGPMAHGTPPPTEILGMPVIVDPRMGDTVAVVSDIDAAVFTPAWSDGPVTPAVAQAMREAGSFLTEAEQNEARDLTPEELAAVQARLRPRAVGAGGVVEPPTAIPEPEYKVGDTVTVGGIEFMKHSDWPPPMEGYPLVEPTPFTRAVDELKMPNVIEPAARRPARARMTAAQVREHGLARQKGLHHRSVSQVSGFADCGTRYALADLERPAWWNVGGRAFHACAEEINRTVAEEQADGFTGDGQGDAAVQMKRWLKHFDAQIAEQCAATPDHPMSTWRAANKGSEHYDWWRVEGPIMVQKYVVWLSSMIAEGWRIATAPPPVPIRHGSEWADQPVIEFECKLNVGLQVPNLSIIDLALCRDAGIGAGQAPSQVDEVLIVDFKAGSSAPKDTFQLGVYGWCALAAGIAGHPMQVRGAYYRARKGEMTAPLPVLDLHPWPDVVQRYRDQDAMERQGVYMPNVTSFCGGCGVRDLCPAQSNG